MAENIDAKIVDEVESRLEDLFGGDDDDDGLAVVSEDSSEVEVEDDAPSFEDVSRDIEDAPVLEEDSDDDFENSPLKKLKAVVLSIDWEITDDIMTKFLDQVNELKDVYPDDRIIQMFLQLLTSVGKYIKAKKENADPDVVRLLNSAFAGLEKVTATDDIPEKEKKRLILGEIDKFKKIREKLGGKPAEPKDTKVSSTEDEKPMAKGEPDKSKSKPQEDVESVTSSKVKDEAKDKGKSTSKGLGFGSQISLIMFLPLLVVVGAGYVYIRQLTDIPSQIDQMVQAYSGVSLEGARNIVLAVLCGLLVLIGLITTVCCSRLARKLKYLAEVVERINAGETVSTIEVKAGGEVGALINAIGRFRNNA